MDALEVDDDEVDILFEKQSKANNHTEPFSADFVPNKEIIPQQSEGKQNLPLQSLSPDKGKGPFSQVSCI